MWRAPRPCHESSLAASASVVATTRYVWARAANSPSWRRVPRRHTCSRWPIRRVSSSRRAMRSGSSPSTCSNSGSCGAVEQSRPARIPTTSSCQRWGTSPVGVVGCRFTLQSRSLRPVVVGRSSTRSTPQGTLVSTSRADPMAAAASKSYVRGAALTLVMSSTTQSLRRIPTASATEPTGSPSATARESRRWRAWQRRSSS
mmetsp:Transcript_130076/g.290753  ORF Transcript_130076/g.290753 Transcript_130076/m.290753 type:complete len:201 (+) Transcript_130076:237-839(+)